MADNENPPAPQAPAAAGKDKTKKQSDGVLLPALVEFTFTFSAISLIILFLTIIVLSLLSGTKLLDIVIRTSVTLLVIGGLLMLISRQISLGTLAVSRNQDGKIAQPQVEELKEIENQSLSEVE
jgi:uncharacterized membrane protein